MELDSWLQVWATNSRVRGWSVPSVAPSKVPAFNGPGLIPTTKQNTSPVIPSITASPCPQASETRAIVVVYLLAGPCTFKSHIPYLGRADILARRPLTRYTRGATLPTYYTRGTVDGN